jgi:hypothetical protein
MRSPLLVKESEDVIRTEPIQNIVTRPGKNPGKDWLAHLADLLYTDCGLIISPSRDALVPGLIS